jgi:small subunit ribosomal protein S2
MQIPSLEQMLQAGAHFGHKKSRWHPKMSPFIFGDRHGIHILNLEETQKQLETVLGQVKQMTKEGKIILFVSTKPQAREIVKAAALECGAPFLTDRWLGGMLTNFTEMKRLIKKYLRLKNEQATGELEKYTKKERLEIGKEIEKMDSYLIGLSTLEKLPDALFLPSVQQEKTAMQEARAMKVPVIGVCDSNANPRFVDYIIPANDDAVKSITLMANLVAAAIKEGKEEREKESKEVGK